MIESINHIAPSVIVAGCVFMITLVLFYLVRQIDRLEMDKAQLESEKSALNNALVDMQIAYGQHAHAPLHPGRDWRGVCECEEETEES